MVEPNRVGSRERGELEFGVRTFHVNLVASRRAAARHIIVYRLASDGVVDVLPILHESMELRRHLPNTDEAS